MKLLGLLLITTMPAAAQYSVHHDGEVIRLEDSRNQTIVSVMPAHGNSAFDMRVKGKKVLQFPFATVQEYQAGRGLAGIPFLAPWANRLDEPAFYANGKRYVFNLELGNVRGPHPIHGFVSSTDQWRIVEMKSDVTSSWVTSRLELFRQPAWMAQFPFAHTIEMTHRL